MTGVSPSSSGDVGVPFGFLLGVDGGELDELATLLTLAVGSATDLDRSLPCFCRNRGNFDPLAGCGEDVLRVLLDILFNYVK